MTPKEALIIITNRSFYPPFAYKEYIFNNEVYRYELPKDKEALGVAQKAVKRLIPERIKHDNFGNELCSNCLTLIPDIIRKDTYVPKLPKPNFCPFCGQALDWSKSNE